MDTALNETQVLIRDSIRDYLQNTISFNRVRELEATGGYDKELWHYLRESGYLGLPIATEFGGEGGELTDFAVLLEELTRRAVVVPLVETLACAITATRHGEKEIAQEIASGVLAGTMTLAPALLEESDNFSEVALAVSNGTITGRKFYVDFGADVTHHLVAARDGGKLGLYLVDANAPEVTVNAIKNIGRTPQANVTYAGAKVRRVGGEEAFAALIRLGRTLASIQCLGHSQQTLDMTVEYVGMRVQFGRPIGSFQAVQHHVANMATWVECTRGLAYEAAWMLDHANPTDTSIAVAKAQASRTATEVPMMAIQLHGGIGVTEEYDLHFFARRGKERSVAWGTYDECLGVMADTIEEDEGWLK